MGIVATKSNVITIRATDFSFNNNTNSSALSKALYKKLILRSGIRIFDMPLGFYLEAHGRCLLSCIGQIADRF
jgi:hypothetical protein